MDYLGVCQCNCPVYFDEDEDRARFTCDNAPCWLIEEDTMSATIKRIENEETPLAAWDEFRKSLPKSMRQQATDFAFGAMSCHVTHEDMEAIIRLVKEDLSGV